MHRQFLIIFSFGEGGIALKNVLCGVGIVGVNHLLNLFISNILIRALYIRTLQLRLPIWLELRSRCELGDLLETDHTAKAGQFVKVGQMVFSTGADYY